MLRYRRFAGPGRYGRARLRNNLAMIASASGFQAMVLILTGALAVIRAVGQLAIATSWNLRERVAYLDGIADLTPSDQPKRPVSVEVALTPAAAPAARKDRVR